AEPHFLRDQPTGRHRTGFLAAMLGVAIFRESVVLTHHVYQHCNGLKHIARVLRTRSAFRLRWSVEKPFPNELLKAIRNSRTGAARNAASVPQNVRRILVPLTSSLNQPFNALSLHVGAIEPSVSFLCEKPRHIFQGLAHGFARQSFSLLV